MNTYKTVLVALLVALAGGLLLWVSSLGWWEGYAASQSVVREVGALFVVTGGLSILWDLWGRRNFADEVLAKAQVGSDIRAAGLERVSLQWIEDVKWAELFTKSREIEVFLSYGQTWRSVHAESLEKFSAMSKRWMRVYLPDPDDQAVTRVLAKRYDTTSEEIAKRIRRSAAEFVSLRKRGGADIRIYFRDGDNTFACYRFDQTMITTLYSHRRKRGNVPILVSGPGALSDFFKSELDAVRNQSREQPSAIQKEGEA